MSKVIFITGTSTGFGKLTAITLANAGYTVIAGMRGTTGKNEAVARELGALPNVEVVEIDVTHDASVTNAFEKTTGKTRQNRCAGKQCRRIGFRFAGSIQPRQNPPDV